MQTPSGSFSCFLQELGCRVHLLGHSLHKSVVGVQNVMALSLITSSLGKNCSEIARMCLESISV